MKLFIYLFSICFACNLSAQGIHFSDNREVPMQLNPAFTGIIHNDYVHRIVLAHRRQSNAVLGRGEFETSYFSYDRKLSLCKGENDMFVGLGMELLHDQVGVNFGENARYFHRQEANINASLGVKLLNEAYIIAGLRLGLLSHRLTGDNLTYDSQFDGRDYNGSLASMEDFSTERLIYGDIGAGLLLRGAIDDRGGESPLEIKTYEFGMSFMHLNNTEKKFLMNSDKTDLGKEYRVHAKAAVLIGDVFRITPSLVLYKYGALFGGKGKEWQVRPSIEFPLLRKWIIAGGMRVSNFADRNSNIDALVFTLKWKPYIDILDNGNRRDNMIVGLSFDMNVSPHLVNASNRYGAFEVFAVRYFTGSNNSAPCCKWNKTKNQAFY